MCTPHQNFAHKFVDWSDSVRLCVGQPLAYKYIMSKPVVSTIDQFRQLLGNNAIEGADQNERGIQIALGKYREIDEAVQYYIEQYYADKDPNFKAASDDDGDDLDDDAYIAAPKRRPKPHRRNAKTFTTRSKSKYAPPKTRTNHGTSAVAGDTASKKSNPNDGGSGKARRCKKRKNRGDGDDGKSLLELLY